MSTSTVQMNYRRVPDNRIDMNFVAVFKKQNRNKATTQISASCIFSDLFL